MNKKIINMKDLEYKINKLHNYELANNSLLKILKILEQENNGVLSSEHYQLDSYSIDNYGNKYNHQIKINKNGHIFLSKRHIGTICNNTKPMTIKHYLKDDGNLDLLIRTIYIIANDIKLANKEETKELNEFIKKLNKVIA